MIMGDWWDEEDDVINVEKYIASSQKAILDRFYKLLDYMRGLPQDHDSYGIIHGDLHYSNFLVDHGKLTAIDFDDCRYEWFASEIAAILFYLIIDREQEERRGVALEFLHSFLAGYKMEKDIDKYWLGQFPVFLKWREIGQYISIHRTCDLNNLNNWCRKFMKNRRQLIEENIPPVEIDFVSIDI